MEKNETGRIDVPYAQVPNEMLYSKSLSFHAKGIWAYIQAKPTGWEFSAERIAEESSDTPYAIRSGIKELLNSGFLIRSKKVTGKILYQNALSTLQNKQIAKLATCETRNVNKDIKNNTIKKDITSVAEAPEVEPVKKVKLDPNRAINFQEELDRMVASKSRPLKVMAAFWRRKGYSFTVHKQMSDRIKRDIRSASTLATYNPEQITMSMDYCQTEYPQMWTLETCIKRIDDLIAQQNLPQFADEHDNR